MKVTTLRIHDILPLIEAHSRMYVGELQVGVTNDTLSWLILSFNGVRRARAGSTRHPSCM